MRTDEWRANVVDNCGYCGATQTLETQNTHHCPEQDEAIKESVRKIMETIDDTTPPPVEAAGIKDEYPRITKAINKMKVMPGALDLVRRLAESQYGPPVEREALQVVLQSYDSRGAAMNEQSAQIEEQAADIKSLAEQNESLTARLEAAEKERDELVQVFKRNIVMHENSPVLTVNTFSDEVKQEHRGFIRGLKRGLEIIELTRTALAVQEKGDEIGKEEK